MLAPLAMQPQPRRRAVQVAKGRLCFHRSLHRSIVAGLDFRQKRRGSPYFSGRIDQWLKMKNPLAPAVSREREIDWAKR